MANPTKTPKQQFETIATSADGAYGLVNVWTIGMKKKSLRVYMGQRVPNTEHYRKGAVPQEAAFALMQSALNPSD